MISPKEQDAPKGIKTQIKEKSFEGFSIRSAFIICVNPVHLRLKTLNLKGMGTALGHSPP